MLRRKSLLACVGALLGAAGAVFWFAPWSPRAERVARPEQPFVPLEAVAASEVGWEVVAPPRVPGPYRKSPTGGTLLGAAGSTITRVRDDAGAVIEEVRLEGDPAFVQLVVFLDTESGGRTLVVMRRPR